MENEQGTKSIYGDTPEEWLTKWDSGESVWSVEMGGLGPGYEQCIQIMVAETLRAFISEKAAEKNAAELAAIAERHLRDNGTMERLSPTGAQWYAALNLAGNIYKRGPSCIGDDEVKERRIQVSKNFPC